MREDEDGLNGLPFWLQAYSSEATIYNCNPSTFWAWAIRNQYYELCFPWPCFKEEGRY